MTIIQQPLVIGEFADPTRISFLQIGQNAPNMLLEVAMQNTDAAVMATNCQSIIMRLSHGGSHTLK
jgi:rRNA-processing protein FCF1